MDELVPINGQLNKGNFDHYEEKNDCGPRVLGYIKLF